MSTQGFSSHAGKRFYDMIARSRTQIVPMEPGPLQRSITISSKRITLYGKAGDHYFKNLRAPDHSNDFFAWVCSKLPKDAVSFDVGANIGFTAAMISLAAPAGKTYCFEPSPVAFPLLQEAIRNNDSMTSCEALNSAVGQYVGHAAFSDNPDSASASHLSAGALGDAGSQVAMTSLDAFADANRIERLDLVKIDVEGFEVGVIAGATRTLAKFRPRVFLEYNSFTLMAFGNENPRKVLELLLLLFPYVYRFENGEPLEMRNQGDVLTFIHDNLFKRGCVDDLLCCYEPLR